MIREPPFLPSKHTWDDLGGLSVQKREMVQLRVGPSHSIWAQRNWSCCPFYRRINNLVKIEIIWLQFKSHSDLYSNSSWCSLVKPSIRFTSNVWCSESLGYFLRWKTFTFLVISPNVSHIDLFLQLFIPLVVVRYGHPRMTRVWDFGYKMCYVSSTSGVDKLPDPNKNISDFSLGDFHWSVS